jgi:hypothetical protein
MADSDSNPQWKEVLEFVRTQTKNDWDRFDRLFKYTASAISLMTVVGIGALVYFVGRSFSEGREEMRRVTKAEVENIRAEVRKRIESEFQTPQIRDVVRGVARDRAGQELNTIIKEEVSMQVQLAVKRQEGAIREAVNNETRRAVLALEPTIKSIVSTQVGTKITEAIRPLDTALARYREVLHTGSIATTAMAGSRSAHSELSSLMNSQNPDIREIATWALGAVDEELFDMLRGQPLNSDVGPEVLVQLSSHQSPTLRLKAVERMGVTKDRRYIPRIMEIIKSDPNIRVLRAALIAFSRDTGVALESWDEPAARTALQWWEHHQSEFKP